MLGNLTGWHFLIILVVILLLFGAPKLPGLARSLGQSMKIFKSEIAPSRDDDTAKDNSRAGTDAVGTDAVGTDAASTDQTGTDQASTPDSKV